MGDCLKRSFEAGLRWCGIEEDVPHINTNKDAEKLSKKYGLTYIDIGIHPGRNEPLIVIYRDGKTSTDSEWHAVFCSDISPFSKWEIFAIITGWQKLRDSVE